MGKQLNFSRKYLETKYSASSVAGVLRVSSLMRSTPMKSPVPLTSPMIGCLAFCWVRCSRRKLPTLVA